jgi:hypothetical protein
VPAAAVIPAPIAYIKVVAVKKLVVELLPAPLRAPVRLGAVISQRALVGLHWSPGNLTLYFEKIRVFKAGNRPEYTSME